jgi:hypothetical protein
VYSQIFLSAMTDELNKIASDSSGAEHIPVSMGLLGAGIGSAPYLMGNLNSSNIKNALPAIPVGLMGYFLGSKAGKGIKESAIGTGSDKSMAALIGAMTGGTYTGALGGKGKHIMVGSALGALAPSLLAKKNSRQ